MHRSGSKRLNCSSAAVAQERCVTVFFCQLVVLAVVFPPIRYSRSIIDETERLEGIPCKSNFMKVSSAQPAASFYTTRPVSLPWFVF